MGALLGVVSGQILVVSCFGMMEGTYKNNATTTDLYAKLIKTVNENVLKNKYNRKSSYEKLNVLEDSGEGWFFLLPGDARKR